MRFEERGFQKKKFNLIPLLIFVFRALAVVFACMTFAKVFGISRIDFVPLALIFAVLVTMQIFLSRIFVYLGKKIEFTLKELAFQSFVTIALFFVYAI